MEYKEGYKYVLALDYYDTVQIFPSADVDLDGWITLSTKGELFIKKGYAWDGPSGPTIDTKTFMRGSLVHDALYQLMREEKLGIEWFDAANAALWDICLKDGMNWFRAWYVHQGVSRFGLRYAQPSKTIILTAP